MSQLEAHIRYKAWQLDWFLQGGLKGHRQMGLRGWLRDRYYWGYWWAAPPKSQDSRLGAVRQTDIFCSLFIPLRHLLRRLIGSYSHRSDFTDPKEGLLHNGRGWSAKTFDQFLKNIEGEETE